MTDRERDTIPAPQTQPSNREILDAVESLRSLVEKVANMVFAHDVALKGLPCYTVGLAAPETPRVNGGGE